jgi:hypothetical protein
VQSRRAPGTVCCLVAGYSGKPPARGRSSANRASRVASPVPCVLGQIWLPGEVGTRSGRPKAAQGGPRPETPPVDSGQPQGIAEEGFGKAGPEHCLQHPILEGPVTVSRRRITVEHRVIRSKTSVAQDGALRVPHRGSPEEVPPDGGAPARPPPSSAASRATLVERLTRNSTNGGRCRHRHEVRADRSVRRDDPPILSGHTESLSSSGRRKVTRYAGQLRSELCTARPVNRSVAGREHVDRPHLPYSPTCPPPC